jgi:hypothetical protein
VGVVLAGVWVAAGVELSGWRTLMALGLLIYSAPSPADLRGAVGRQAVQQENKAMHTNSNDDGGESNGT